MWHQIKLENKQLQTAFRWIEGFAEASTFVETNGSLGTTYRVLKPYNST